MNSGPPVNKILILAVNPKGTSRLRLDEELREIKNGLRQSKGPDKFEIELAAAVRYRDIHREIMYSQPQIVHFSGHGAQEKGLVFEDETGKEKLVDAEALAGLFELFAEHVKCVLLNACYSEIQAQAIAQHIDYVIGMSKEIGDEAAIEFAIGFYDALGAGKSVEYAHKLGCRVIRVAGIPESLTPKLLSKNQLWRENANTTAPFSADIVADPQFSSSTSNIKQETSTQVNYTQPQDLLTSDNSKQANIENMEVFLSYSPNDEPLRKELEKSLSTLESQGTIQIWYESKITPGRTKKVEIDLHLKSARIILLLISRYFLSSVDHLNLAKRAMERRECEGTLVIPVLLSSVAGWQTFKLGKFELGDLQPLPKISKFFFLFSLRNA
ncbi:CHAT domain-containing protein [Iningainema tapete]|uniref:CHAT domain-containing protein n=1 Tax=Iningainema tapete BLCC-T55 TaxID=2748662 RepID=A0A8J6XMD6_9CYAN|nr:CHAT domain-containing protein [Iningainema tapete]MBD2774424.1 CHAT domain-containing protein [Iningainema tapete BLCC-T55]